MVNKYKFSYGFTLVESLVSLAIVVIITAATIPLFAKLSNSQGLNRNVGQVATDIKLVQSKAMAGAVYDGKKVMWGVRTCQGTDGSFYNLGYALDENADGVPDASFVTARSVGLISGYIFGGCDGTTEFYFTRIAAKLVDSAGGTLNSVNVSIEKSGNAGVTKSVVLQGGGKVNVE